MRELLKDAFGADQLVMLLVTYLFGVPSLSPVCPPPTPGKFQFSLSLQPRPLRKPQNRKRRQKSRPKFLTEFLTVLMPLF